MRREVIVAQGRGAHSGAVILAVIEFVRFLRLFLNGGLPAGFWVLKSGGQGLGWALRIQGIFGYLCDASRPFGWTVHEEATCGAQSGGVLRSWRWR